MNKNSIYIFFIIFFNFFKKKYQKYFYINEQFKNKIKIYKNRIIYIYDNNIFEDKDLIRGNYRKNIKKYKEILIRVVSKRNKFNYKIDNKYYSRKIYPEKINFLNLNTDRSNSILIKGYKDTKIFRPILTKKKSKKKLVLALLVDGFGHDILNYLPNSKKFFGMNNLFTNVWANSNWTLPSYGNFITGKYAANHKGYESEGKYNSKKIISYKTKMNIYEYFSNLDFVTGCYSPYMRINPTYNSAKGADIFCHNDFFDANQMTENIISQIEMFKNNSNFIFAHFFDGHGPRYKKIRMQEAVHLSKNNRNFDQSNNKKKSRAVAEIKYEDEIETVGMFKYIDTQLNKLYEFLKSKKFDDYTIILFGDHGTRLGSNVKNNFLLSNNICNINLFVKDKKKTFNSAQRKKIIQMIDFYPSLAARYPYKNTSLVIKETDGINSIFSKAKNNFSLTETQYNAKVLPERPYEINVRKNNNQLYSINSFKKDKITKSSNIFLNKSQKKIDINKINKNSVNQLLSIKNKHIKQYD
tara:strand:+ start:5123 stop:6697 length:1575 start_codon:yes stop_codon:yes gene_type:complete